MHDLHGGVLNDRPGFPCGRRRYGAVDNGIPVVYLNIDESQVPVEEMINSPDHSVYCYGTISIVVPEGFRYADFPDTVCESLEGLEMSIRGRGNSTWQKGEKNKL